MRNALQNHPVELCRCFENLRVLERGEQVIALKNASDQHRQGLQ